MGAALSHATPLSDAPEPSVSPNARFLAGTVPHGADGRVRFGNSIVGSAFTHVGGFLLALLVIDNLQVMTRSTEAVDDKPSDLVWFSVPGPGRRGGDGGDGRPERQQKTERPRRDPITLAAATPPELAQERLKPDTEMNLQTINALADVVDVPGALTRLPIVLSQGNEVGGGAGIGRGTRGSGFGAGNDRGIGTGVYGPGSGVTMPTVLTEVKPSYTAEAMRARVQGAVIVEAIVREDGSVGQVRIVRSLDRTFGLDDEALKAVRNWRFRPGRRQGQNVAVIVEIELMFTLR